MVEFWAGLKNTLVPMGAFLLVAVALLGALTILRVTAGEEKNSLYKSNANFYKNFDRENHHP